MEKQILAIGYYHKGVEIMMTSKTNEMKSEKEIKELLYKLQSDERLSYPSADVWTNAPLALIQVELESKVNILKWVLGIKK